jgi:hypothetical protein
VIKQMIAGMTCNVAASTRVLMLFTVNRTAAVLPALQELRLTCCVAAALAAPAAAAQVLHAA